MNWQQSMYSKYTAFKEKLFKSTKPIKYQHEQQTNDPYIFDLKPQYQSNISSKILVFILNRIMMPQFKTDAQSQQLQMISNTNDNRYRIEGSQIQVQAFKQQILNILDNLVILEYSCRSSYQASMMALLLQSATIIIRDHLQCQSVRIISYLDLYQENCSQDVALDQYSEKIFAIVQDRVKSKIEVLQLKFVNLVNQLIKIDYSDSVANKLQYRDMETLQFQLKLSKGLTIIIFDQDNATKKYIQLVKYKLSHSLGALTVNISEVENGIHKILSPVFRIKLDKDNEAIWLDVISKEVLPLISEDVIIKTREDQIQIHGDILKAELNYKLILQRIQSLKFCYIQCILTNDHLRYVVNNQIITRILQKDIEYIKEVSETIVILDKFDFSIDSWFFKCIYKPERITESILDNQLKQFVNQISMYIVENLQEILQFFGISEHEFELTYSCVIISDFRCRKGYHIICTKQRYQYVELLIEKFKLSYRKFNNIMIEISVQHPIVLKFIQTILIQQKIEVSPNIKFTIQHNKIILCGPENETQLLEQLIKTEIKSVEAQYTNLQVHLKTAEIKYFWRQLSKERQQIENKENCQFSLQEDSKTSAQILFSLNIRNKTINVVHADLSYFKTEAIINFCNSQLNLNGLIQSKEISQKILRLGDDPYYKACIDYIYQYRALRPGVVFPYYLNNCLVQYILSIATPQLNGAQFSNDLAALQSNIQSLMKTADLRKIKEITIQLMQDEQQDQTNSQFNSGIINAILESISQIQTNLQTVNVIDMSLQRLNEAIDLIDSIISGKSKRQVKYQWQWEDNNFKDYDPDINEQIDEAYEQFQKNHLSNEIQLIFPYLKSPGTHIVNLQQNVLIDKDLKTTKPIRLVGNQHSFGGQPVPDLLNNYLIQQKLAGKYEFEIFYKRYKIIFTNNNILQVNEETNYQRQVQFVQYPQNQSPIKSNTYKGHKFEIERNQFDQSKKSQILYLSTIGIVSYYKICNEIQDLIRANIIKIEIKIPHLKLNELKKLEKYMQKSCFEFKDQLISNKQIKITIFKEKHNKILKHLEFIKQYGNQYPDEWIEQSENFIKVELIQQDNEYQKVSQLFRATMQYKQIHKIYKIQNQVLWDNYVYEKQKLLQLRASKNVQLENIEVERYLWHGVSKEHPRAVYNKEKEAFDITYSNNGMWGTGMYFAEKASYSDQYSYQLKLAKKLIVLANNDNRQYYAFIVGKPYQCAPDQSIKRPPDGFDCVSGFTNGSDIYVLYQMDVRRAYPAYEIIFN